MRTALFAALLLPGLALAAAPHHFKMEKVGGGELCPQLAAVPFSLRLTARTEAGEIDTSFTGRIDFRGFIHKAAVLAGAGGGTGMGGGASNPLGHAQVVNGVCESCACYVFSFFHCGISDPAEPMENTAPVGVRTDEYAINISGAGVDGPVRTANFVTVNNPPPQILSAPSATPNPVKLAP